MDLDEELVERIADRCHIDNMRTATKENDKNKHFLVDGKPLMYRKGMTDYSSCCSVSNFMLIYNIMKISPFEK